MYIRDFERGDINVYLKMSNDFYASIHTKIHMKHLALTFNLCIEKSPHIRGLIFEITNIPVGFSLLTFTYSNELGGLCLWIDEIYISPDYQNQGLARKFMDFLLSEYKDKVKIISLEVEESNMHAIHVYEHLGFRNAENKSMYRWM